MRLPVSTTMAPVLARSAVAAGADGLFAETHPRPDDAKSDGPNMIPLDQMPALCEMLARFHSLAAEYPIDL